MRLYDVDRPVLGYISGPVGPDSESGDAVFTVKGGLFDIKAESGNNHIVNAATGSGPIMKNTDSIREIETPMQHGK